MMDQKQFSDETRELLKNVMPNFAGIDPDVIGAALSFLIATWLTGHRPGELRDDARASLDKATEASVKFLDAQYEKHIRERGH